jgi:hypothetical protein
MKDAPAFDFYPERWLAGVAMLSDAEQLAFLRLLCQQWLACDEGLPADPALLKRAAGKGVTPALLEKFPLCEDGRRRNAKLERIRAEQRERITKKSEQRRAAAMRRWHPNESEPDAVAMRPHDSRMVRDDAGAMPTTHHSPCTERESTAGAPADASGQAHAARDIAGLYPRQDAPAAVLEAILDDLNAGEEAETIRRQVAECAEHIRKAPGGSSNRYVPTARAFFTDRQWRSPEAFAARWAPAEAAGNRQAKPTRPADISDVDPRKIKEL